MFRRLLAVGVGMKRVQQRILSGSDVSQPEHDRILFGTGPDLVVRCWQRCAKLPVVLSNAHVEVVSTQWGDHMMTGEHNGTVTVEVHE
jgi:hypothetical protein